MVIHHAAGSLDNDIIMTELICCCKTKKEAKETISRNLEYSPKANYSIFTVYKKE